MVFVFASVNVNFFFFFSPLILFPFPSDNNRLAHSMTNFYVTSFYRSVDANLWKLKPYTIIEKATEKKTLKFAHCKQMVG